MSIRQIYNPHTLSHMMTLLVKLMANKVNRFCVWGREDHMAH